MLRRLGIALVVAMTTMAAEVTAQTGQRWSIQLSALGVRLTGADEDRLGVGGGGEIQLRWNPSAFSIGVGGQTTVHELENVTVTYRGGFIEPRLILGTVGESVAIYGSARLMTLSTTIEVGTLTREIDGTAVSAGGGLLINLASRVNIDLGITSGKEFYNGNAAPGATVVSRFGFAIGL